MQRRFLPTINALTAFESAARHGSIVVAAEELALSQSAVSRLIRQVEEALQAPMFERVRQRLVLTEAGRIYARDIRKILDELEQTTFRVMGYGDAAGTLSLGVFSTFATKWLIPRLPGFHAGRPGVVINCYVRNTPFDFDEDVLDAAIHHGEPLWPNAIVEPLFGETLVPVASPDLPRVDVIRGPADIADFPLLHEVTRPLAWRDWFDACGVSAPDSLRGARFDQFGLIMGAAVAGMGIALVPSFLTEDEIARGTLVRLAEPRATSSPYSLVYPHRNKGNRLLEDFRDWIIAESGTAD